MRDLVDRAEGATGAVVNGTVYGCGGLGCVFPTKDGNVLKISNSWGEREIVEALVRIGERKGAFSGFARVIHHPVSLQYGVVDGIWAYVRERVTPAARRYPGYDPYSRDDDWLRLLESLIELSDQAEMENVPEYDEALKHLERQFEGELVSAERGHTFGGIAKTLRALFDDGILLYDMKLENIGERKDGTIVLFDAEPQVLRPRKANPLRGNGTKRTTMKQPPTFLFSYGSNSPRQLEERLGHPVRARRGYLEDWKRAFVGHSERWGGAPATMVPSPGDLVYGTLVEVTKADLATLDRYEGVPRVYQRQILDIVSPDLPINSVSAWSGTLQGFIPVVKAVVYLATSTKQGKPSAAYLKAIEENVFSVWELRETQELRTQEQRRKVRLTPTIVAEAAAHAKSIRAAMGDDALDFARAERAAANSKAQAKWAKGKQAFDQRGQEQEERPGVFWDEVVRVLDSPRRGGR
jgi:hypothetical protein